MKVKLTTGLGIFLPFGDENLSSFMPEQLMVRVRLSEHAVSQIGPIGPVLRESEFRLNKKEIRFWNSAENCSRLKTETRPSFKCMSGPWMGSRQSELIKSSGCRSIHPYPIFFSQSAILSPGVNFINILRKAFKCADPKKAKRDN
jgi:hypothetical protein